MTVVYYKVRPPGEPDIYHNSAVCAGSYDKAVLRQEAEEADAEACRNCFSLRVSE